MTVKTITKKLITVLCLEGCHGSGKTELCKYFSKVGFTVLDEAFLDMPTFSIPNQSLTMETVWVSNWFQRLLKMELIENSNNNNNNNNNNKNKNNNNKNNNNNHNINKFDNQHHKVFIADRSPFSAILYSQNNGHYLDPIISEQIKELKKYTNIDIKTVYLKVEKDVLWERIQKRLQEQPERKKYNEDNYQWMHDTVDFYDSRKWDYVIENNTFSPESIFTQLTTPILEKQEQQQQK
ncbi:hypothetical protein ACTFIY_000245 [Dictyostelium cf. discoideum]